MVLAGVASCNEPETVVTNIVHPDGTVLRRIEMKKLENKFEVSDLQVPFDSTWTITDSLEINMEGDTIWIKRDEKLFSDVEEINRTYLSTRSKQGHKAPCGIQEEVQVVQHRIQIL